MRGGLRMALAAVGLLAAGGAAGAAPERCGLCHPQSRVAYAESIHAGEGVGCTDCHGGDPASRRVETAHDGNFRPLSNRLEIPRRCAECHADREQMRAYNLPIDQYAVYQTSGHGQLVAAGDPRGAVCSDCHGAHETRPASDAASSVHPSHLPATCGTCHSDAARMADFDLDVGVVDAYRSSVHGVALLERGNSAAPDCSSCHGTHGPAPPGIGDVDKVCGACHAETRRAFLDGPHAAGMAAVDLPECASCHANHAIRRFTIDNTEDLCAECHESDSEAILLGRKIHTMIAAATEEVDKAEALAQRGERAALHVEDHLSRVEEARTYITEALPLVHAVSLEPVDLVVRRARSIGLEVQHELYAKLDRRPAHVGLVLFWFYVLMTLVILVSYKRRLLRRGEGV